MRVWQNWSPLPSEVAHCYIILDTEACKRSENEDIPRKEDAISKEVVGVTRNVQVHDAASFLTRSHNSPHLRCVIGPLNSAISPRCPPCPVSWCRGRGGAAPRMTTSKLRVTFAERDGNTDYNVVISNTHERART